MWCNVFYPSQKAIPRSSARTEQHFHEVTATFVARREPPISGITEYGFGFGIQMFEGGGPEKISDQVLELFIGNFVSFIELSSELQDQSFLIWQQHRTDPETGVEFQHRLI